MLKKKEYKIAYALVAQHNLPKKFNDFWEAEWMAGWIALRFLDQPKVAYNHFTNLYNNVSQPVTLSVTARF
jgi:soluble lytic murein transglycosylase